MITLYDIPSTIPDQAWSPNTWRTRLALNFKGLPYKTEWVEYPDIESTCKRIGARHTMLRRDGTEYYTLPVIHDDSNDKVISDSWRIAIYLDLVYPDKPLFHPGSHAATWIMHGQGKGMKVWHYHMPDAILYYECEKLNPPSKEFFIESREKIFGHKLEELKLPADRAEREKEWEGVKTGLASLASAMSKNKNPDFFFGDSFSFADIVTIAELLWIKKSAEPIDWEIVCSWDNGKWKKLVEDSEQYQTVQ